MNKFPENETPGKGMGRDFQRRLMELVVKHSRTHTGGGWERE
jgi:hypothetical protein